MTTGSSVGARRRDPTVGRVVVVGAGPVGQTAALLLARYGIPVTLLDARPARDHVGSKAICQQRDVLDVWSWCGAGAVLAEGLTWTRARTFYRDLDLFVVDLPDPGASPLPPFVNISQSRTEEILDELIAASPLVEVLWGHEVVGIDEQPGGGVQVTARTTRGPRSVRGRYAVACAGARGSTVRHLVGVEFTGRTFADAFLICDIRADLPGWADERRFYFDPAWNPGRQVLIHPCPGGVFRIDWQVDPDFDLEAARADGSLHARIVQVIGERPYDLVWSSLYHFHARTASRFRVGDVFLAGDLAHLVSPFGARGLNSGVGDVDNLAWKLAAVLQGWAPESLLDSYEAERMAAARENLEVTTATMDFLVPATEVLASRRHELLERSVHDLEARREVDSGRLCEPFWYVESPLTTPDPGRPWPGRPDRGSAPAPVPGVILPDATVRPSGGVGGVGRGASVRLRELVRGCVTVLADAPDLADAALAALRSSFPGVPSAALDLSGLDGAGPVMDGLGWERGDLWLVRPDAHTAARVRDVPGLVVAVARMLAAAEGRAPVRGGRT